MQTIPQEAHGIHEVKRSKFLSFLVPIHHFDERLEALRAQHPKARHFVTATRRLNSYDQIEEGFGDDGEPRGVAGMPSLKVLQGHNLIHVGLITVRYFGGIKLGTGGMARAYADAANAACAEADIVEYIPPFVQTFDVPYEQVNRLEFLSGEYPDVSLTDKEYNETGMSGSLRGRESSVRAVWERFREEYYR